MEELRIQNGINTIVGHAFRPNVSGKAPAIIVSHGYNGSHQDFFKHCAFFAEKGFFVYAYDFCGGSTRSMSTGATSDMTISSEVEDLKTVYAYISSLEEVDEGNIILFGESQGGLVTCLVAEELKDCVRGMALYYPALCIPEDWKKMYPDLNQVPEKFDFWNMELGKGFVEDVYKYDVFEMLGGYDENVLIIHGDQDVVVNFLFSDRAAKLYKNARIVKMPGQGHGFEGEASIQAMEMVLDFAKEQTKDKKEN